MRQHSPKESRTPKERLSLQYRQKTTRWPFKNPFPYFTATRGNSARFSL